MRAKLFISFLFWGIVLNAQIIPKPIEYLITQSDYIFEGQVIRSNSYWNQDNSFIYTSHTIEISKIFKGDINCGTVEMLTVGGVVGNRSIT